MSKKPLWVSFYPVSWLNGTAEMSLEEVGAYIQITALLYDNENAYALDRILHPITGKVERYGYSSLARRLHTRPNRLERLIASLLQRGKLSLQAGYLTSPRVGDGLREVEIKSSRSRVNAHTRWRNRGKNVIHFKGG